MKHILGTLIIFFSASVAAEDPFASKPNILWWSDDFSLTAQDSSNQYDSFISQTDVWNNDWGFSGKLLQNDDDLFGIPDNSAYLNIDVKRRFLGNSNNFLAVGLGWQDIDIESRDADSRLEVSGPKLSLEGQFNLFRSMKLYGQTAWFPEMDSTYQEEPASGYEFEAGVMVSPLPALSLKAGFRHFELKYDTDTDNSSDSIGSTSGFLLGSDFSW